MFKKLRTFLSGGKKDYCLPNSLSDCIKLAVKDLTAIENNPNYTIDMESWHMPDNSTCAVCFAGSVMANTCKAPIDARVYPGSFNHHDGDRLQALNSIRVGAIRDAVTFLYDGYKDDDKLQALDNHYYGKVIQYHVSPSIFKETMLKIAKDLKSIGF